MQKQRGAHRRRKVVSGCCAALFALGVAAHGALTNHVVNPSFENPPKEERNTPDDWDTFYSQAPAIQLSSEASRDGEQCVKVTAQGKPEAYQGLTQRIPVEPGEKYTFEVYVRRSKEDPPGGGAHGQLVIEWLGRGGKEVSRTVGGEWDQSISAIRWTRLSISKVRAPKGAKEALFGIHFIDGTRGSSGAILIDDVAVLSDASTSRARGRKNRR